MFLGQTWFDIHPEENLRKKKLLLERLLQCNGIKINGMVMELYELPYLYMY